MTSSHAAGSPHDLLNPIMYIDQSGSPYVPAHSTISAAAPGGVKERSSQLEITALIQTHAQVFLPAVLFPQF